MELKKTYAKIQEKFSHIKKEHIFIVFVILILGMVLYYGLAMKGNTIAKYVIVAFVALTALQLIGNRKKIPQYINNLTKNAKKDQSKEQNIKFKIPTQL